MLNKWEISYNVSGKKYREIFLRGFKKNCCSGNLIFFANIFLGWYLKTHIVTMHRDGKSFRDEKLQLNIVFWSAIGYYCDSIFTTRSSTHKNFHRWFLYFDFCNFFHQNHLKVFFFQYRMSTQNEFLWSLLCWKRVFSARFSILSIQERIFIAITFAATITESKSSNWKLFWGWTKSMKVEKTHICEIDIVS